MMVQDRQPGGLVRRQHHGGPVESTGAKQRGVDIPWMIGGPEQKNALVVRAHPAHLGEELVDYVAH